MFVSELPFLPAERRRHCERLIVEESYPATDLDSMQSYRNTGWEGPEAVTCVPSQSSRVDQTLLDLPQQVFV